MAENKGFIFLAGLHRSGTSLLHEILREHPEISGFSGTGVPEDEGQHLQSVYSSALAFGGPGKFVFNPQAYMNETHPLATDETASQLLKQWSIYNDFSNRYFIEKSPPTIIRTRFFQKLFPKSKFIVILRHPLAVSYATEKWSNTSIASLLDHTLLAYEKFFEDMAFLNEVYVLRYEEFILNPQSTIDSIYKFLGLKSVVITHNIDKAINEKYFNKWGLERKKLVNRIFYASRFNKLEVRSNKFGYSLEQYRTSTPVAWLGSHSKISKT